MSLLRTGIFLLTFPINSWAITVTSVGDENKYLIASFPTNALVNYLHLPDTTWRPLVNTGLKAPTSICMGMLNSRLFVADTGGMQIVWYDLQVLADGKLVTNGFQNVAVNSVTADALVVDSVGNLFFSGTWTQNSSPIEAIFVVSSTALATAEKKGIAAQPVAMWTANNTGTSQPGFSSPTSLAVDPSSIYWTNGLEARTHGVVVRAGLKSQNVSLERLVHPMADNADWAESLVLTRTAVFYATSGALYGISRTKANVSCSTDNASCPLISTGIKDPKGMTSDGDHTVFVADGSAGMVYSFASGSTAPHPLEIVSNAPHISSIAFFSIQSSVAVSLISYLYSTCFQSST